MSNVFNELRLPLPLMLRWRRFVKDGRSTLAPKIGTSRGGDLTTRCSDAEHTARSIENFVGRHGSAR